MNLHSSHELRRVINKRGSVFMTENVFIGRLDGHAEENRTEFSLFVRISKSEAEH